MKHPASKVSQRGNLWNVNLPGGGAAGFLSRENALDRAREAWGTSSVDTSTSSNPAPNFEGPLPGPDTAPTTIDVSGTSSGTATSSPPVNVSTGGSMGTDARSPLLVVLGVGLAIWILSQVVS